MSAKQSGQDTEAVKKAKQTKIRCNDYVYTDKELLLYNLGCGAKASDLDLIFEGAKTFKPCLRLV